MGIFLLALRYRKFLFALCGLVLLSSLLSVDISRASELDSERSPIGKDIPEQRDKSIDDSGSSTFVFEEPGVNGSTSLVAIPELDDRLDLPGLDELPRIAIIIDDMGQHQKIGGELLDLDLNLTFSFLPHGPFTKSQEERAWRMGRDVLVHMPMEPKDSILNPGPGTLYLKDSAENIVNTVEKNLEQVPHAIGVNNHMGSKFTADRQAMHEVLSVLQEKGLFFVDSLTTPESIGADEAKRMGVKTGRRIIFLDNSQNREDICRQLRRLVAFARKHGEGIGIGHPNRATINALKDCRELLLQQVNIVGISELVR